MAHQFEITAAPSVSRLKQRQYQNFDRQKIDSLQDKDVSVSQKSDSVASGQAQDKDFSFFDILDIFNPLQHIPVVSSIYRAVTGDEIKAPARVLGGALFGGPVGLIAGVVNTIVDESSGHDIGEHVVLALKGNTLPGSNTGPQPTGMPPTDSPTQQAPVMVATLEDGRQGGTQQDNALEEFRAGAGHPNGDVARTQISGPVPQMVAEPIRDDIMASRLLHDQANRAEARAGGGRQTPSPVQPVASKPLQKQPDNLQPADMVPAPLQPSLSPDMMSELMMENLDKYGDMVRARFAPLPGV